VCITACSTDVPDYDYDGVYDAFAFNSLLTRVESIKATGTVAIECNEVANKCLYHVPTTKPMRIEEFEQTQAQVTSQVREYFFL
jgi:dynein heavy chain